VSRLRKSNSYIKELSLVAELDGKIVGYIMTSKLYIKDIDKEVLSSAIAPVAVEPDLQKSGAGSKMIRKCKVWH
jgi:predicted N-acetyltransferase YhbS